MSKFINKAVTAVSSIALAAMMLVSPLAANSVHAATSGEVYKTTDGTVWFITSDMHRRPFTSAGALLSYGFLSFSQVKEADSSVTGLPTGDFIAPQDGRIFCATETKGSDVKGECSLVTGGKKAAFTSSTVFSGQGYSFSRAFYGDSSFLSKTSNVDNASAQHMPGTLINNGGTVQLVVSGGLWGVPSMDVFNSWGWSFADVVPANSADKLLSQTGVIPARMAGQLVPTATTGTPVDNGDLNGSVGDITVTASSVYSAEQIGEGESDQGVLAFKVKAGNDSDVRINSVKVKLAQTHTGDSKDITDYIDEVTIMRDADTQVGSADPADFNEDANVYTKSISLSGNDAIVRAGETATFSVAISALDSLDSSDIDSATFTADVLNVRFTDADGVTTTVDTDTSPVLDRGFGFQDFATAADVELRAALNDEDTDINDSHNILVSDDQRTNDVPVLSFTLEARGDSDITVKSIPVVLDTSDTNWGTVATTADLYEGSEKIASDDIDQTATDVNQSLVFDDLDVNINAGDTEDFTVKINVLDAGTAGSHFAQGTTVQATLTVSGIDADDQNGDTVQPADLTGSAISSASSLFSNGITVDVTSATATVDAQDGATNDLVTFKWDVSMKNIGDDDVYVNADNADVVTSSDATNVDDTYTIQNSGSAVTASGATITNTGSTSSTTVTGVNGFSTGSAGTNPYTSETFYKLTPGQTKTFRITVTGTNHTTAGQVRAYLTGIEWTTDSVAAVGNTGPATINTYNPTMLQTDSQTDYVSVN
jgi:hypothetical protein